MRSPCLAKSLYWSEAAEPIGKNLPCKVQNDKKIAHHSFFLLKRLTFRPPGALLAAGGFNRSWLLWRSPLCSFGCWPDTSVPAASPLFPPPLSHRLAAGNRDRLDSAASSGIAARLALLPSAWTLSHSVMWWCLPLLFFYLTALSVLGSCYSSALCEHLGVRYLAQGYPWCSASVLAPTPTTRTRA